MNKCYWALFLALPLLVFCEREETDKKNEPTVDAKIEVIGETTFDFDYQGGTGSFSFTCNTDWKVATNDSWLEISQEKGAASTNPIVVTFTCLKNESLDARKGAVYVFAGKASQEFGINQAGDPMYGAGIEVTNGASLLATNPNVEKFLTEVTYPDRNWSYTDVMNYYGGFNDKTYNEKGEEDPNGQSFNWGNQPNSDQPMTYSIRWAPEDVVAGSPMTLVLEDILGWKEVRPISAGAYFVNITNLVPNDEYTYSVTADNGGKVLASGSFTTTGHLHQIFFNSGCRNGRDLGGWKTLDGKTVKYRKVYRGGRMQSETVNTAGRQEIIAEGIGAQLDLRGNSDVLSQPCISGFDFCNPVIEEGGTAMLVNDAAKVKQCFEFVVNCVRNGKGVYFHCSLGRDRTGTLDILLLGLLGVREGDIGKAYEVTYFAPVGYSVSSSERSSNPKPIFRNARNTWVYSVVAPYFWNLADKTEGKTFAEGVEKYLLEVAGVSQKDIDDFRSLMLE